MEDNELIASFEPKLRGYVLVVAFDDLESMFLEQERIQANFRQTRDDEGKPLPQTETLWMSESQLGERQMMAGQVRTGLLVTSEARIKEIEEARRGWAQTRMQRHAVIKAQQGVSSGWEPDTEQHDFTVKWVENVLELHPAGRDNSPRIKVSVAREGFRQFCLDHDCPELAYSGTIGGRQFSAVLKDIFQDDIKVLQNDGRTHSYIHGLCRKEGVNRRYFRLP
jgi:hypothetical protein